MPKPRQTSGVNYVVPSSRWSARARLCNGGRPGCMGRLSHRRPVGGVIAAVICVPIVHCEFARWTRRRDLDQYWGDKVQGDCVVGRELLEGSFFGCTGVALAV